MRLVWLNGLLLALCTLAVVALHASARAEASLESSVRRYAVAVAAQDLDAALAEIAPPRRSGYADWVNNQLGNEYDVRGIAVRTASLLSRQTRQPHELTAILDVNRRFPAEYYPATTRVPVEQVDGHWYLAAPLLFGD